MQFLITTPLSWKENLWLSSLRTDLHAQDDTFHHLAQAYEAHSLSNKYKSAMDLIMWANWTTMKEWKQHMCDAIRELFAEEFEEYEQRINQIEHKRKQQQAQIAKMEHYHKQQAQIAEMEHYHKQQQAQIAEKDRKLAEQRAEIARLKNSSASRPPPSPPMGGCGKLRRFLHRLRHIAALPPVSVLLRRLSSRRGEHISCSPAQNPALPGRKRRQSCCAQAHDTSLGSAYSD